LDKERKHMSKVIGIVNRGTECYMTVVFQLMARMTVFIDYLRNLLTKTTTTSPPPIMNAVVCLMEIYQNATSPILMDPVLFLLPLGEQHDAHEYLVFLLDTLNEEAKQYYHCELNPLFFNHQMKTTLVFESRVLSSSVHTENVLNITLSGSIEESIQRMEIPQPIPNWRIREHEPGTVTVEKNDHIIAWPLYLFISIQRYGGGTDKDHQSIDVPERLGSYRLVGSIIHFGTRMFGHYVAVVRPNQENGYFMIDDHHTQNVSNERAMEMIKASYLVLYIHHHLLQQTD